MQRIALESLAGTALDADARVDLDSALKSARRAGGVLVLTGSAGAWAHTRIAGDASVAQSDFHALALAVLAHPAPVVASLAGAVTGFGVALAAAADVRVATAGTTICLGKDAGATALTT